MDVRRELGLINKQFDWFYHTQGETVVWYEFQPLGASATGSTYDDIYDEGNLGVSGIKYKTGVALPVLRITEIEDSKRAIPDARVPFQNVNLFVPVKSFRNLGISNYWDYEKHLNDMFKWDGRFYGVHDFQVRGRLRDEVYVLVEGIQVYVEQEMVNDPGPTDNLSIELPWPTGLPILG